jgi:hypothetical protein
MAIPASGPISLTTVQTEFGGSNPIGINEYYAGGGLVPAGTSGTYGAVPSSGTISLRNFYGTSSVLYFFSQLFNGVNYNSDAQPNPAYTFGFPIAINNDLLLYTGPNNGSLGARTATIVTVNRTTGNVNYIKYLADENGGVNIYGRVYQSSTDTLFITWGSNASFVGYDGTYSRWGRINNVSTTPTIGAFYDAGKGGFNGGMNLFIAIDTASAPYQGANVYYNQIYGYDCYGPLYRQIQVPAVSKKFVASEYSTWFNIIEPLGGTGSYGYTMSMFISTAPVIYIVNVNYYEGGFGIYTNDTSNITQTYNQWRQTSGTIGYLSQGGGCTDNAGNVYYASAGVSTSYKLNIAKVNGSQVLQFAKLYSLTGVSTSQNATVLWGSDGYLYVTMSSYASFGNCISVYKLDSNGVIQWARLITPSFQTSGTDYMSLSNSPNVSAMTDDASFLYLSAAFDRFNTGQRTAGVLTMKIAKATGTSAQTVSFNGAGGTFAAGQNNVVVSAISSSSVDVTANTSKFNAYGGRTAGTVFTATIMGTGVYNTTVSGNLAYAKVAT